MKLPHASEQCKWQPFLACLLPRFQRVALLCADYCIAEAVGLGTHKPMTSVQALTLSFLSSLSRCLGEIERILEPTIIDISFRAPCPAYRCTHNTCELVPLYTSTSGRLHIQTLATSSRFCGTPLVWAFPSAPYRAELRHPSSRTVK